MFRNFKVLLLVLAILMIAGSAYAFAAQNTIEDSDGGGLDKLHACGRHGSIHGSDLHIRVSCA
jgi:hypothetical protein